MVKTQRHYFIPNKVVLIIDNVDHKQNKTWCMACVVLSELIES
jgi:hypothetical protein